MNEISLDSEKIYLEYHPKVLGYISSHIFNKQESEDIASSVFIKVFSALPSFDEKRSSISTWIFNITQNTVRDYMRRCKTRTERTGDEDNLEIIPFVDENANGDSLVREEMLEQLANALELLPERERDIVVYHYYKGMSHKDIAEKMNLGYSNVRFLCHRAVSRLREEMSSTA